MQTALYRIFQEQGLRAEGHGKETRLLGISKELCELHSKRHQQIDKEIQRTGAATAKEKEQIQRRTRHAKKRVPQEQLFAKWHAEFDQHGLTAEAFASLHKTPRPANQPAEITAALDRAAKNLAERQSYFSEARYTEEVFVEARGKNIDAAVLRQAVEKRLGQKEHIEFLSNVDGEKLHTTRAMMELERRYFSHLRSAKGTNTHKVSVKNIETAILELEKTETKAKGEKVTLTDEQREAVFHMCRGEDAICVLTGDAGTGKSFVCKAARRAFELEGFRSIGATIARKAAIGLEEGTGIKSTSVAKLIGSEDLGFRGDLELDVLDQVAHHAKQIGRAATNSIHRGIRRTATGRRLLKYTPLGQFITSKPTRSFDPVTVNENSVVFVDEAAQLSSKDMEKLVRLVRERGGKICLLGDGKQLQPIAAGQPFLAASTLLGEARLTHIIRQRDEADREVSRAFSRGDAAEAIKSLVARDRFHQASTVEQAMARMLSDWARDGIRKGKDNLLLCSTNAERAELNRLAQMEMMRSKRLGKFGVTLNGETFHRGDRIAFTHNSSYYQVANGSTGAIQRIGRKRLTWRTFHGKQFSSYLSMAKYAFKIKTDPALWITVKLDNGKVVDIPLERYQNFRLGYAFNSYQAQGMTVKNCFCLLNRMAISRENLYVSASRARDQTHIYTAGITTTELVKQASKSRIKKMAHDFVPAKQQHVHVLEHAP